MTSGGSPDGPRILRRVFRFIIAKRWWVVGFHALLLVPGIRFALAVGQDDSVERLVVRTDPDYVAAEAFAKVFGHSESAILVAEAADPFSPGVLKRLDEIERRLEKIRGVGVESVLSIFRRTQGGFQPTPARCAAFREFATDTDLFARQGLVGARFLSIVLSFDVRSPEERRVVLDAVNLAVDPTVMDPKPLLALRKTGEPYVNGYFEDATRDAALRSFPLFGAFVVLLILFLYRSFRALSAFLATIASSLALTVGYAGLSGDVITIVSSLVPMTVLVTCTATLVYIHSRFVEHPAGRPLDDHQVDTLANKFLPCTASLFATAVGFAALAVSHIRPIREMGIWVAAGILITWGVVFTLFPALQRILRTPTQQERSVRGGRWFVRLAERLPAFTFRWRWVLVPASLAFCAAGAVALFGLKGVVAPMSLESDALDYIDPGVRLAQDTRRVQQLLPSLSVTEVWLAGPPGSVVRPEVLLGLDRFSRALEADERVGSAVGPTTVLRLLQYVSGLGDRLPEDRAGLEAASAQLENLLLQEPELRSFVDVATLSETHITVLSRVDRYEGFLDLDRRIAGLWKEAVARDPALEPFRISTVGTERLQAKIAYHLVPTLVDSFLLTAAVIFLTFLLLFRSGPARLMAMIPSLFAILAMFGFMRLAGIGLNVATILIASTVLGTSENDQIHFFYHFSEARRNGSVEDGLRHTLLISGRAIFFATMINAGGFLAFALSDLPPMRELGILSALAFVLSMLADFTALPAALWILGRHRPDAVPAAPASE
ncbi:MAG: MMPL family transporter [Acidobacteriia bacterium]|nr:MMPL family transporter [Terriglobia bacterium]